MTNLLPRTKQIAVLTAIVDAPPCARRRASADVTCPTVLSLFVRVSMGSMLLMDRMMRNLAGTRWQLDEQWGFVHWKQRRANAEKHNVARDGHVWTYVAVDAETRLAQRFRVGKRDAENMEASLTDFASRLRNRVQVSTGLRMNVGMIPAVFDGEVDFATVVKSYEAETGGNGRYSALQVTAIEKTPICGEPITGDANTSPIEPLKRTRRSQIRRMTRLTNAHTWENHIAATALHFVFYRARIHSTTRVTLAPATGVANRVRTMGALLDAPQEAQ